MGRKSNKTGRNDGDGRHVRDYEWMLKCQAYRSLSAYSRCLLTEMKRLYNGTNNGDLYLSVRDAAAAINANKGTASKAFRELEQMGFIRANQAGSFAWKSGKATGKATSWILEEFGFGDALATKAFMRVPALQSVHHVDTRAPTKIKTRSHHVDKLSHHVDEVSATWTADAEILTKCPPRGTVSADLGEEVSTTWDTYKLPVPTTTISTTSLAENHSSEATSSKLAAGDCRVGHVSRDIQATSVSVPQDSVGTTACGDTEKHPLPSNSNGKRDGKADGSEMQP